MSKFNTLPAKLLQNIEQAKELQRIAELEDRLNQNSSNSSTPPFDSNSRWTAYSYISIQFAPVTAEQRADP